MPFALPTALAAECLDRLGAAPPVDLAGAGDLLARLSETMPRGTTAKLEAVDDHRVPPGADPRWVAEMWLERPALSWSCWAMCTLYAALVNEAGVVRADVVGMRRVDPGTRPVDLHSVVELAHGARRWLTDPYFWVPPVAAPGGDAVRPAQWAEAVVVDEPGTEIDGPSDLAAPHPGWRTAVGSPAYPWILRYRALTRPLSSGDVEAFCRISTTHTGVPSRARVDLARPDGMLQIFVDRDGRIRLGRWRAAPGQAWIASCERAELDRWPDAEEVVLEAVRDGRRHRGGAAARRGTDVPGVPDAPRPSDPGRRGARAVPATGTSAI